MDQVRIKFYSVSDMSTGWFLHKIDEYFLEQHDSTGPLDINTALEMLNIKKFLDSGARLIQWGTRQVEEYKRKGNKIPQYIRTAFQRTIFMNPMRIIGIIIARSNKARSSLCT